MFVLWSTATARSACVTSPWSNREAWADQVYLAPALTPVPEGGEPQYHAIGRRDYRRSHLSMNDGRPIFCEAPYEVAEAEFRWDYTEETGPDRLTGLANGSLRSMVNGAAGVVLDQRTESMPPREEAKDKVFIGSRRMVWTVAVKAG